MYTISMTTYYEVTPAFNVDVITGSLEHLNNQMVRLYFNLQREGWKISNAGYGFIVARHIQRKQIFFAKICYTPERTLPLAKNNMHEKMFKLKK